MLHKNGIATTQVGGKDKKTGNSREREGGEVENRDAVYLQKKQIEQGGFHHFKSVFQREEAELKSIALSME